MPRTNYLGLLVEMMLYRFGDMGVESFLQTNICRKFAARTESVCSPTSLYIASSPNVLQLNCIKTVSYTHLTLPTTPYV